MTASYRWLELRGAIIGFSFSVVGSQNIINVSQKNVEVLVGFTTQHILLASGFGTGIQHYFYGGCASFC